MLKDFFDSFDKMNLAELSLPELVHLDEITAYYENVADLSRQRAQINQEYMNRKASHPNLRFTVHEIKTGFKTEDWEGEGLSIEQKNKYYEREKYGWNPNFGWKFHLDIVPNRNYPTTKAISDFLIDLCVAHKVAHGGENGKGMTVYVGSYDDICRLSHIIQEKFGSKISKPPIYTDQVTEEYPFESKVYGRFCVSKFARYPRDIVGISCWFEAYDKIGKCYAKAVTLGELDSKDACFFHHRVQRRSDKASKLAAYCSHKLYVAAFGQYYYGKHLQSFEEKFLDNKVPASGTPQRQKWDEVADTFVQEAKEQGLFETMRNKIRGYIPLDLSRFTNENQTSFEHMRNDNGRR